MSFHPKPRGFQNTKTTAIKQLGHESIIAFEMSEDSAGFCFSEDDGNPGGAASALNAGNEIEFAVEHLLIKKKQSAECLILGRGRHVATNREMAEKGADFFFTHSVRVTFVVKENVTPDPIDVGLLGSDAVAFNAQMPTDAVEKLAWPWPRG
jgi:hypothetical protein